MTDVDKSLRPPAVRPVDADIQRPPSTGSITQGGTTPSVVRMMYLRPWERDPLLLFAPYEDGYETRLVTQLVRSLADAGLLTIEDHDDRFVVTITDEGRIALQRGWYPCV